MGSLTTDTFLGREGASPATPAAGIVALYAKADSKLYMKDDTGTEVAILTDSVAAGDKILTDNLADAWQVREAANKYMAFVTTDGAEKIQIGDSGDVAALELDIQAGTVGWTMASLGQGLFDVAGVLELNSSAGVISIGNDDVNQNINIGTDGDRTITVGVADAATQLDLNSGTGGMNLVTTGDMDLSIADNTAAAWLLHEGAQNYLAVVTTDASEAMSFGNATTNPTYGFLGSGQMDIAGPVDMNAAFTGTGAYSYNQSVGTYTYNVAGSIYSVTSSQFLASGASGAADAIRLVATAGGGIDIDAGTLGYRLDSSGSVITTGPDNTATMWQVKEGANSYIKAVSTNGSEVVKIGENLVALKDITSGGILATQFGIPSGQLAVVGGTTFVQDVASAVISNSSSEILFNKESVAFPANTLIPGRRLRIHASGLVVNSEAGAQPLTIRLKLHTDTGPVDFNIMASIAADTAVSDIWEFDAWVTVRTGGTSSTRVIVVSGGCGTGAMGAMSLLRKKFIGAGDFDETLSFKVQVSAQWTNVDANNQVRMDDLSVELF